MAMGYQEAVLLGEDYAVQSGYAGAEMLSARQVLPNIWRIRFGLAPKGSGRMLEIELDGTSRRLLKSTELSGVRATATSF